MNSKSAKSVRLQMVISPEEIDRIDDWRREQPNLPSRSEAIRRLIELGLEAAKKTPRKERA